MWMRIFLVLSMSMTLAGCGGGSADSESGGGSSVDRDLNEVIVVIGDSIGFGVGTPTNFASMIESLTGIRVINASVPGISAEEGANRVRGLIETHAPQYLVVLLGTNNATGAGGKRDGAVSSLQFIADVAAESRVVAIIGTLPPITRNSDENYNSDVISQGIRGIGNARIAEVRANMNGSHINPDGLHPNILGHEIMASAFSGHIN